MNIEDIKEICWLVGVPLVLFLVLVSTLVFISNIENNVVAETNCELMEKNGHTTHIENKKMFGLTFKDCYIQTQNGTAVPYDRFMVIE